MMMVDSMKNKAGFTLIEVLITMLVLGVGLLGLAGLQTTGLRNNLSAYNRSQATQLAYDFADRMRANVEDAGKGDTSTYITQSLAGAQHQTTCVVQSTSCLTANMAQQDLFEWNRDVAAILPEGVGSITQSGGLFTLTVKWDDNRDGCTNPGDATTGCDSKSDDPRFTMSFRL